MSLRQSFGNLLERSHLIAKRILKFLAKWLEWTVTSLVVAVLGLAIGVGSVAKVLYQLRNKIVGIVLLVSIIVLTLNALNQLMGFKDYTDRLHMWFIDGYHWALVVGGASFVLAATWEYVAPTLRTLFGRGWTRLLIWGLSGTALIILAYMGLLGGDVAYRGMYIALAILYMVVLATIAKIFSPDIPNPVSSFIDDNPAGHEGSEPYETQKRIITDIKNLIQAGKPSTVAITGHWGIGKTFLLRRAKAELGSDGPIIWMNFEPWRYASEEALIRGFYQTVGVTLAEKIPGVQHIIQPLTEAADKFIRQHDGTGFLGATMDALHALSMPVDDPERQIGDLLNQEGRRLVIVIDDVERSFNPERIFRTLQLAHFAKNIVNVQVVFLYEKEVVLKACPSHLVSSSPTEYLEKFVDVEVFVPSPRLAELRQLFASFIGTHRSRTTFDMKDSDLPDEMLSAIETPRLVKTLANEFAAYRLNQEEAENGSR